MQKNILFYYQVGKKRSASPPFEQPTPQKRAKLSGPRDIDQRGTTSTVTPTDGVRKSTRNEQAALDKAPREITELIASYLESDEDLKSFRSLCRHTRDNYEGHNGSFWRDRFLENFDQPRENVANIDYKKLYLSRRTILRTGASFQLGYSPLERQCVRRLRDMIQESYTAYKRGRHVAANTSKNISHLIRFAESHGILDAIFRPSRNSRSGAHTRKPESMLQMVQVLLAPCFLSFNFGTTCYQYPTSQQAAFSTEPLFIGAFGMNVNMELLLHSLNFWRHHMLREDQFTLYQAYNELHEHERPQTWRSQLSQSNVASIGKTWKGSYGFVDQRRLERIRNGEGLEDEGNGEIEVEFTGQVENNEFQNLSLHLHQDGLNAWPPVFEQVLKSLQQPVEDKVITRSARRSIQPDGANQLAAQSFRFAGDGEDSEEEFLADGWMNPLPAQDGVSGWRRLTMMKYFVDELENIDYGALWAYEGVVLPGGQIIIGRWWSPMVAQDEDLYSGPFILWCVDTEDELLAQRAASPKS